nr:uncharacterized protein LOC112721577 [Arachis hypogaea]
MTSLLKQLQVNQRQPPSQQPLSPQNQQCQQFVPQKVCGICSCYSHYTDECPSLQEDNTLVATHNFYDRSYYERANQGYHNQGSNYNQGYPQQGGNYNQGSNNSNQGWRDNFNQSWRDNYQQAGRDNGGNQRWNNNTPQNRYSQNPPNQQPNRGKNYQTYVPPHRQPHPSNQPQAPQITYPSTSPYQDDTLWSILQGQKELQNTLNSSLNGLTSTLQALIARMEPPSTPTPQASTSSAIPSQPLPNPKGGINAVTLRSRTQLKKRDSKAPSPMKVTQEEDGVEIEEIEEEEESHVIVKDEDPLPRSEVPRKEQILEEVAQPIPFSTLARKAKKHLELDPTMVKMFKKVEVTIPLFDAIHQVPKYAKFLKDLCMNKDRIHELETIPLGSSILALMGSIPEKCVDPSPCLVSCVIDGVQFIDCMCDLGACVSIMPLSVYHLLKLPLLKRSAARFVLADKSIITVSGIAEDVLVDIKGLIFPIDFHIIDMPPSESERASSILLGRPFLRTFRFKLDAHSGTEERNSRVI